MLSKHLSRTGGTIGPEGCQNPEAQPTGLPTAGVGRIRAGPRCRSHGPAGHGSLSTCLLSEALTTAHPEQRGSCWLPGELERSVSCLRRGPEESRPEASDSWQGLWPGLGAATPPAFALCPLARSQTPAPELGALNSAPGSSLISCTRNKTPRRWLCPAFGPRQTTG